LVLGPLFIHIHTPSTTAVDLYD